MSRLNKENEKVYKYFKLLTNEEILKIFNKFNYNYREIAKYYFKLVNNLNSTKYNVQSISEFFKLLYNDIVNKTNRISDRIPKEDYNRILLKYPGLTFSEIDFIYRCELKFGIDTYDFSQIKPNQLLHWRSKATKESLVVEIICKFHGSILVTPVNFLKSDIGCHKCGLLNRSKRNFKIKPSEEIVSYVNKNYADKSEETKMFISCSIQVWGFEKDSGFNYSKVEYSGKRNYINLIYNGIEYNQFPFVHLDHCLPKAATTPSNFVISKGEEKLNNYIISNKHIDNYIIQKPLPKFWKDDSGKYHSCSIDAEVYYKNSTYWIEYNGSQHYKPTNFYGGIDKFNNYQIPRDNAVREYAKQNGIILIEIPYTDYNNIEIILNKYFK